MQRVIPHSCAGWFILNVRWRGESECLYRASVSQCARMRVYVQCAVCVARIQAAN